jgi:hypothetical protein
MSMKVLSKNCQRRTQVLNVKITVPNEKNLWGPHETRPHPPFSLSFSLWDSKIISWDSKIILWDSKIILWDSKFSPKFLSKFFSRNFKPHPPFSWHDFLWVPPSLFLLVDTPERFWYTGTHD